MKRALIAGLAIVAAAIASGCASADHTWRGEFDARLEGAETVVEEAAGELQPSSSEPQVFRAGIELSRKLEFRRESIEELDPPAACEAVQEAGARKVSGFAEKTYDLYKNLTPFLHRRLPRFLKEEIAAIGKIKQEAETCE